MTEPAHQSGRSWQQGLTAAALQLRDRCELHRHSSRIMDLGAACRLGSPVRDGPMAYCLFRGRLQAQPKTAAGLLMWTSHFYCVSVTGTRTSHPQPSQAIFGLEVQARRIVALQLPSAGTFNTGCGNTTVGAGAPRQDGPLGQQDRCPAAPLQQRRGRCR